MSFNGRPIGLSANTEGRYHLGQIAKGGIMRDRLSGAMLTVAIAGAAVSGLISVSITRTLAQAPAPATLVVAPLVG
jgi:hypothetical protein